MREHCKFAVGDRVWTRFTGDRTEHAVIAVQKYRHCQSGWLIGVEPPLLKHNGARAKCDAGWFHLMEEKETQFHEMGLDI